MLFYDETLPHYNQCNFVAWKCFVCVREKEIIKTIFDLMPIISELM